MRHARISRIGIAITAIAICLAGHAAAQAPAKIDVTGTFIYADGAIREMVLWQLPEKAAEKAYGLKYRLYTGWLMEPP